MTENGNTKTKKKEPLSIMWLLPIFVAIAVVPLVTIIHVYDCGLESNQWFSIGGKLYDFFLYYKAFILRLIGVIILFSMAYLMPFEEHDFLKQKKSIAPTVAVGIFGIISLLSALLADNKITAFFGGYEQFEGWFILLAYVLCFYFSFGYIRTVRLIKLLLDVLLVGAMLIGILGTFQAFGMDWIQSDWAKPIITSELMGKTDLSKFNIKLNFGEGMSYVTLYNPNYVGSYVSLVLPMIIYIVIRGEKLIRRLAAVVCSILLIITLVASRSLTGVLGLMVGLILCAVLLFPFMKKLKPVLIGGLVLVTAGIAAIVIAQPAFLSKLMTGHEEYSIESMVCEDDHIDIVTSKAQSLRLSLAKKSLTHSGWSVANRPEDLITLKDGDKDVSFWVDPSTGEATINEEGYYPLKFSLESRELSGNTLATYLEDYERYTGSQREISVSSDEEYEEPTSIDLFHVTDWTFDWTFTVINGKLMIYNDFGRIDELSDIEKSGFEGSYYFASRRGYIWSRTIPMLTDYLLVGVGADHFVFAFPNDDYVGKRYMGYDTQTITKPHNMYFQIWVQDGLPALIAFLLLYIFFIVRTVIMCFGKHRPSVGRGIDHMSFAVAVAVSVTGYLVVGLANDSTITVAPIYWVLLGAGYAAEAVATDQR